MRREWFHLRKRVTWISLGYFHASSAIAIQPPTHSIPQRENMVGGDGAPVVRMEYGVLMTISKSRSDATGKRVFYSLDWDED
jgi:hypothetical protein